MSGLEIAGVLLGAFPLIISGLEHWRDVAKVGGFFWRIRKEYTACRREVQFYEIVYKRNLKELLLPIVEDLDEVSRLVSNPGGDSWKDDALEKRLEKRLQESYQLYMEIICEMNERAEDLRKELAIDKSTVQSKLSASPNQLSKLSSAKTKLEYEAFRVRFSFGEPVRNKLFEQLKECNGRLEKLLHTSDSIATLKPITSNNRKRSPILESVFKTARRNSDLLFKAIQKAWQCPCQEYHLANLRLEHRRVANICYDLILTFTNPLSQENTNWSWIELECKHIDACASCKQSKHAISLPYLTTCNQAPVETPRLRKAKKVAFTADSLTVPPIELETLTGPDIKLCRRLGSKDPGNCIGVVEQDEGSYHLLQKSGSNRYKDSHPITLNHVLSSDFEDRLTRRQRYLVALILASSVAQLQFTSWIRTDLNKKDILFYSCDDSEHSILYGEPFIRQGFPNQFIITDNQTKNCNFYSLGILLLELCFGQRLEDQPLRKKFADQSEEANRAFDLMAALEWSHKVHDEAGDDYASAVKWCFVTSAESTNRSWQGEIIKNVIGPLEKCQESFNAVPTT